VISVENRKKFSPLYIVPPLTGFPLELGTDAKGQKPEWWDYHTQKSFKIGSAVYTQYRRVTDRQTDRRTNGHSTTAKTALCRASHE